LTETSDFNVVGDKVVKSNNKTPLCPYVYLCSRLNTRHEPTQFLRHCGSVLCTHSV